MSRDNAAVSLQTTQLHLPFQHDPQSIRESLEAYTGRKIILSVTDNAVSMLSARHKDGRTHLRLHRLFLHADENVMQAVAGFIRGETEHRLLIRDHIRKNSFRLKGRPAARTVLNPRGRIHCLTEIGGRINRKYFEGRITAGITWGRRFSGRRTRRITLGSYCRASDIIRINPLLDRRTVPVFFLDFIVYHEMLHVDLGFAEHNGRRRLHTREFRTRERLFAEYDRAMAWEKSNL